jgi:predicted phosphodiesterase
MLMAIIGDIRGNLPALEGAIQLIESLGIQSVGCTGNLVAGAPWPNEVMDQLDLYRVQSPAGDYDRYVANFARKKATMAGKLTPDQLEQVQWTARKLQSRHIETLRDTRKRLMTTLEGLSVCLCHGSPTDPAAPLHPDDPEEVFLRQREFANVHIVACGKSPQPFHRFVQDTLFVNPGTLGMPVGDRLVGTFALIDTDASPWSVETREVTYSRKRIVVEMKKSGMPPSPSLPWLKKGPEAAGRR